MHKWFFLNIFRESMLILNFDDGSHCQKGTGPKTSVAHEMQKKITTKAGMQKEQSQSYNYEDNIESKVPSNRTTATATAIIAPQSLQQQLQQGPNWPKHTNKIPHNPNVCSRVSSISRPCNKNNNNDNHNRNAANANNKT